MGELEHGNNSVLVWTCCDGRWQRCWPVCVRPCSLESLPSWGSQVLLQAAPQLLHGILHGLNRSAHQRLADPLPGVAMAAAAERIWMFLGWDCVAGCAGAEQGCSPSASSTIVDGSTPGAARGAWMPCCVTGGSAPVSGCRDADLCIRTAHLSPLQSGRGGGSPSCAAPHVEVGQLNYTLRNACFSALALEGAATASPASSVDSVGA